VYEIGVQACELLLSRIAGDARRPSHHRLATQLLERASIAPPPA